MVNERVSDKLSGGPKQGTGNQLKRDQNRTGNSQSGAGRGRNSRPFDDEVMDSAVSGRSPLREPERRGNIYDPEHPNPDRNPSV